MHGMKLKTSFSSLLFPGNRLPFAKLGNLTRNSHHRDPNQLFGAVISSTRGFPVEAANSHMSVPTVADQTTVVSDAGPNVVTDQMTRLQVPAQTKHQTQGAHKICQIPQIGQNEIPTPVNWQKLNHWLDGYPHDDKTFLITGFREGFRIGHPGSKQAQDSPNLKTALQQKEFVSQKISSELNAGRLGGPFKTKPFQNFVVSPLGVVPKKNPGSYRMIHHLSYPRNSGCSVNEHIPKELTSVASVSKMQLQILRC